MIDRSRFVLDELFLSYLSYRKTKKRRRKGEKVRKKASISVQKWGELWPFSDILPLLLALPHSRTRHPPGKLFAFSRAVNIPTLYSCNLVDSLFGYDSFTLLVLLCPHQAQAFPFLYPLHTSHSQTYSCMSKQWHHSPFKLFLFLLSQWTNVFGRHSFLSEIG